MQADVVDETHSFYKRRDLHRGVYDEKMFYVSGTALCSAFFCFILLVLLIVLAVLVGRTNELLRHLVLQNISMSTNPSRKG